MFHNYYRHGAYKDHSTLVQSLLVSGAAEKPDQLDPTPYGTQSSLSPEPQHLHAKPAPGSGLFAPTNLI